MVSRSEYDVVVVGAGPGGYVAAIRAAQLGLKTAVVERDELGGVCLNWGCIPSKALLKNAEVLFLIRHAEDFGISYDNLQVDYPKAIDRSRAVVTKLTKGVAHLLRKNNVDHIKGEAYLKDAHTMSISPNGMVVEAKNLIIATGARPRTIPPLPIDGELVITSREALELKELPSSIVIVGGGATGVEFAYLYNAYGVSVTLVEILPHLLPNEDEEISQQLEHSLSRKGINIMTNSKVVSMTPNGRGALVQVEESEGVTELACEKALVSVGVQANIKEMGLEEVGIATTEGFIQIDEHMTTNVPKIYAIGDATGKLLLAHVASAQGIMAVETIAGLEPQALDYQTMPRATYCNPQVASFGLTEKQSHDQGYEVKIGKFPFQASGKALALGESEGMVKLVVDAKYGEILGAHMIGAEVTELLAELSMTRMLEGTTAELGWLVHSHPTLSEALKEAALAIKGEAIHM